MLVISQKYTPYIRKQVNVYHLKPHTAYVQQNYFSLLLLLGIYNVMSKSPEQRLITKEHTAATYGFRFML